MFRITIGGVIMFLNVSGMMATPTFALTSVSKEFASGTR